MLCSRNTPSTAAAYVTASAFAPPLPPHPPSSSHDRLFRPPLLLLLLLASRTPQLPLASAAGKPSQTATSQRRCCSPSWSLSASRRHHGSHQRLAAQKRTYAADGSRGAVATFGPPRRTRDNARLPCGHEMRQNRKKKTYNCIRVYTCTRVPVRGSLRQESRKYWAESVTAERYWQSTGSLTVTSVVISACRGREYSRCTCNKGAKSASEIGL